MRAMARAVSYGFKCVTVVMLKAVIGWPATDTQTLLRNFIASGGKP